MIRYGLHRVCLDSEYSCSFLAFISFSRRRTLWMVLQGAVAIGVWGSTSLREQGENTGDWWWQECLWKTVCIRKLMAISFPWADLQERKERLLNIFSFQAVLQTNLKWRRKEETVIEIFTNREFSWNSLSASSDATASSLWLSVQDLNAKGALKILIHNEIAFQ